MIRGECVRYEPIGKLDENEIYLHNTDSRYSQFYLDEGARLLPVRNLTLNRDEKINHQGIVIPKELEEKFRNPSFQERYEVFMGQFDRVHKK